MCRSRSTGGGKYGFSSNKAGELDIKLGILTNRDREFFDLELKLVDDGAWVGLFEVTVCVGDSTTRSSTASLNSSGSLKNASKLVMTGTGRKQPQGCNGDYCNDDNPIAACSRLPHHSGSLHRCCGVLRAEPKRLHG